MPAAVWRTSMQKQQAKYQEYDRPLFYGSSMSPTACSHLRNDASHCFHRFSQAPTVQQPTPQVWPTPAVMSCLIFIGGIAVLWLIFIGVFLFSMLPNENEHRFNFHGWINWTSSSPNSIHWPISIETLFSSVHVALANSVPFRWPSGCEWTLPNWSAMHSRQWP